VQRFGDLDPQLGDRAEVGGGAQRAGAGRGGSSGIRLFGRRCCDRGLIGGAINDNLRARGRFCGLWCAR
jgi:hypothetical protein